MDQNRTLSQLSGKKNCATLTRDQTAGPVRSLSGGFMQIATANTVHKSFLPLDMGSKKHVQLRIESAS